LENIYRSFRKSQGMGFQDFHHGERSEAIHAVAIPALLDCFVASLLAMTGWIWVRQVWELRQPTRFGFAHAGAGEGRHQKASKK
jgi:hypothetical protein